VTQQSTALGPSFVLSFINNAVVRMTIMYAHPKYDSHETENEEMVDWKQNAIGPVSSQ
jgi:hypothetical protein